MTDEDFEKCPSFETVHNFIDKIFRSEQVIIFVFLLLQIFDFKIKMSSECLVMSLAYIDRLVNKTEIRLCGENWRKLLLSSFILATKVWEEQAVWNVDFLSIFPKKLEIEYINTLERKFLKLLRYNVSLKASEYAKYYFELSNNAINQRDFQLKPLTKEQALKLEKNSTLLSEPNRKKRIYSDTNNNAPLSSLHIIN